MPARSGVVVSFPTKEGAADLAAPFFIYSGEGDDLPDLAPIKLAKATLDAEGTFPKVRPVRITLENRFEFDADRVLCIGYRLPWACDYALITPSTAEAGWLRAVKWMLTGEPDPKVTTVTDFLNSYLGPGVREMSAAELESERKMRAFITREE